MQWSTDSLFDGIELVQFQDFLPGCCLSGEIMSGYFQGILGQVNSFMKTHNSTYYKKRIFFGADAPVVMQDSNKLETLLNVDSHLVNPISRVCFSIRDIST